MVTSWYHAATRASNETRLIVKKGGSPFDAGVGLLLWNEPAADMLTSLLRSCCPFPTHVFFVFRMKLGRLVNASRSKQALVQTTKHIFLSSSNLPAVQVRFVGN